MATLQRCQSQVIDDAKKKQKKKITTERHQNVIKMCTPAAGNPMYATSKKEKG
jgi:hypothetical protein